MKNLLLAACIFTSFAVSALVPSVAEAEWVWVDDSGYASESEKPYRPYVSQQAKDEAEAQMRYLNSNIRRLEHELANEGAGFTPNPGTGILNPHPNDYTIYHRH